MNDKNVWNFRLSQISHTVCWGEGPGRGEAEGLGEECVIITLIVEKATRGGERALSPRRASPFLAWGEFHARSRFARSTIPDEEWGTTRILVFQYPFSVIQLSPIIDIILYMPVYGFFLS